MCVVCTECVCERGHGAAGTVLQLGDNRRCEATGSTTGGSDGDGPGRHAREGTGRGRRVMTGTGAAMGTATVAARDGGGDRPGRRRGRVTA